jgi:hypothetical protein
MLSITRTDPFWLEQQGKSAEAVADYTHAIELPGAPAPFVKVAGEKRAALNKIAVG